MNKKKGRKGGGRKKKRLAKNNQERDYNVSGRNNLVVYYHSQEPMPPRYRSSLEIDYTGYLTASAASSFVTAVSLNKIYQPGTLSVTGSTAIGSSPWNLDSSYSATTNPQGYSNLIYNASTTGGIYTYYKVLKSRITLEVYPVAYTDNLLASITAIIGNNPPSSFTAAQADRFTKKGAFTPSQSVRNRLILTVKPWDLHGVSKEAWINDESGEFGSMVPGTAPTAPSNFVIWLLTSSAANLGNQCSFRIRVRYWVQFGGLLAIHETVSKINTNEDKKLRGRTSSSSSSTRGLWPGSAPLEGDGL